MTALLTLIAMLAFAANSILCRLALGGGLIDAASFTAIRMVSGAVILVLIALPGLLRAGRLPLSWRSSAMLFAYMACFSFAYRSLDAGTGALLLFGAVQLTMFIVALRSGEGFPPIAWAGFAVAAAGLLYLVFPGLTAPDPLGAVLMTIAGVAWGFYSLLGRGVADPVRATAGNFLLGVPLVLLLGLLSADSSTSSLEGIVLAVISGAVTSALGYVIWYAALKGLAATRAATVQLSVPVIAAFGGVAFLGEALTPRLTLSSAAVLGGVWVVLGRKSRRVRPAS